MKKENQESDHPFGALNSEATQSISVAFFTKLSPVGQTREENRI